MSEQQKNHSVVCNCLKIMIHNCHGRGASLAERLLLESTESNSNRGPDAVRLGGRDACSASYRELSARIVALEHYNLMNVLTDHQGNEFGMRIIAQVSLAMESYVVTFKHDPPPTPKKYAR